MFFSFNGFIKKLLGSDNDTLVEKGEEVMKLRKVKSNQNEKTKALMSIDEKNYAFMRIGIVSDKTVYHSIERKWSVWEKGKEMKRGLKIEPGVDTGIPTAFEIRLWVALQKIAFEYDETFTVEWIPFTFYQVCKLMGMPDDGRNLRRIVLGLERLTKTSYSPQSSFWDGKKQRCHTKPNHHLGPSQMRSRELSGDASFHLVP